MTTDFTDIRIIGLDEERTTRADPTEPLYDVHFVLSEQLPSGWAKFVWPGIGRKGIAGRQGWPLSGYFVVRCAIGEVPRVLAALQPIVEATNRRYREWTTSQEHARAEEEEFDKREREKLRKIKAQLAF